MQSFSPVDQQITIDLARDLYVTYENENSASGVNARPNTPYRTPSTAPPSVPEDQNQRVRSTGTGGATGVTNSSPASGGERSNTAPRVTRPNTPALGSLQVNNE